MLKIQYDSPKELSLLDGALREMTLHAAAICVGAINPNPSQMLAAAQFIRAACHQLDLGSKLSTPGQRQGGQ